jgi:hypothetical protein
VTGKPRDRGCRNRIDPAINGMAMNTTHLRKAPYLAALALIIALAGAAA